MKPWHSEPPTSSSKCEGRCSLSQGGAETTTIIQFLIKLFFSNYSPCAIFLLSTLYDKKIIAAFAGRMSVQQFEAKCQGL